MHNNKIAMNIKLKPQILNIFFNFSKLDTCSISLLASSKSNLLWQKGHSIENSDIFLLQNLHFFIIFLINGSIIKAIINAIKKGL